ncbi:T9SS type A sorting domain-containing protein [Aquimarina rhabdastrellae]
MKKKHLPLLLGLMVASISGIAQDWRHSNKNYFEILEAERDRIDELKKSSNREDQRAVKQFERWSYYWRSRVNNDGTFPDARKAYQDWKQFEQNNTVKSAAEWTLIGPTAIPESVASFYAGLGRLNVVAFNPNDTNEIWVGSPGGGVWNSTDGGNSWIPKGDVVPNLGVSDIVVDPSNPNIIYLATGDADGRQNGSIGVLKSTDKGSSWNMTGLELNVANRSTISHLLIDPSNVNTIFATTSSGIYKSTDGGNTWNEKRSGAFNDIVYKEGSTTTLFASSLSNSRFFISTDNGETWTNSSSGISNSGRLDIATTAADEDFIVVMTRNGSLFKSTNGGGNWTPMSNISGISTQGGYNQTLAISPNNKNLIIVGGVHGWRSTNGGNSWERYLDGYWTQGNPYFYVHSDHHDLKFMPGNGDVLFSANDGGLFKGDITTNNAWTDLSAGLAITQYYKVAGTPQNANFLLAGAQDNDITHYDGNQWINRHYGSDGVEALWNYSNSDIAWTCSQFGTIQRTTDGFATGPSRLSTPGGAAFVWPLEIDPNNPNTIYGGFGDIYKSNNSGNSWINLNSPASGSIEAIAIAPSNNQILYVIDGARTASSRLHRTTNGGTSWSTINQPSGGRIKNVAIHPTNPNEIYICYGGYNNGQKVYKSTDGGSNWENISRNLPNFPINKVAYLTGGNGDIFVGSDIGVFHSNDDDTEWKRYGSGLPNVIVNDIEIHYATEKLRVATYGRGVWEVSVNQQALSINEFETDVLSIYPNPSKGKFTLKLKDLSGESTITIYNLIGGVIKHFKTSETTLGIDLSNVASGMYFVNVENGGKKVVKKAIVK